MVGGVNLYAYVENDPINDLDPLGLVRGARRYRTYGSRNPYASMEYNALFREIRRINPRFSVIRNQNRDITWRDVHWLREQLWKARYKTTDPCLSNKRGFGNIGGHGSIRDKDALRFGNEWIGPGYREVGPTGSGVF